MVLVVLHLLWWISVAQCTARQLLRQSPRADTGVVSGLAVKTLHGGMAFPTTMAPLQATKTLTTSFQNLLSNFYLCDSSAITKWMRVLTEATCQ